MSFEIDDRTDDTQLLRVSRYRIVLHWRQHKTQRPRVATSKQMVPSGPPQAAHGMRLLSAHGSSGAVSRSFSSRVIVGKVAISPLTRRRHCFAVSLCSNYGNGCVCISASPSRFPLPGSRCTISRPDS